MTFYAGENFGESAEEADIIADDLFGDSLELHLMTVGEEEALAMLAYPEMKWASRNN